MPVSPSSSNFLGFASAGGKVLVAGGFVILDRRNTGCVVSADAKIHCAAVASAPLQDADVSVTVKAVQFNNVFQFRFNFHNGVAVLQNPEGPPMLRYSVQFAAAAFAHSKNKCNLYLPLTGKDLTVVILGDNPFYCSTAKAHFTLKGGSYDQLREMTPFLPVKFINGQLQKTGLGSSAAVVSSVVTALGVAWGVDKKSQLHSVAQLAHNTAQGKIGSGFDVQSAFYGSHFFRRHAFDEATQTLYKQILSGDPDKAHLLRSHLPRFIYPTPELFQLPLGVHMILAAQYGSISRLNCVVNLNNAWNKIKFKEAPGPRTAFQQSLEGDVSAGSDTPSMVSKVLSWRGDRQPCGGYPQEWQDMVNAVNAFITALKATQSLQHGPDYKKTVQVLSSLPSSQWLDPAFIPFKTLARAMTSLRHSARIMGRCAGVEIIPTVQDDLCRDTSQLPGVIGATVPGAGGNDAITCLVIGYESQKTVRQFWEASRYHVVCLPVNESTEGIRTMPDHHVQKSIDNILLKANL